MLKFSAVSQILKKYIQKLNDWDLPLNVRRNNMRAVLVRSKSQKVPRDIRRA